MAEGSYLFGWDDTNKQWRKVAVDENGIIQIGEAVVIDETPVDGNTDHAISSDWAYDHENNANIHHTPPVAGDFDHNDLNAIGTDDHHAKYTDAEAQAACGLSGTLYWSIPGCAFMPCDPYTYMYTSSQANGSYDSSSDGEYIQAAVTLPHGVTVTGAEIFGDAAAQAETWSLIRVKLSDLSVSTMATANVGTEDTTISNAVIDNSTYAYFLVTSTIDTGDTIYGGRISFTV